MPDRHGRTEPRNTDLTDPRRLVDGFASMKRTRAILLAASAAFAIAGAPGRTAADDVPVAPPVTTAPATTADPAAPASAPAAAPSVVGAPAPPSLTHAAETPPGHVAPPAARVADATPPERLADLSAWLDYKSRRHIAALPLEARLFHRRGVLLMETGNGEEGARMVRGAAELDPGYIAPQLSLAEWSLLREPSQSLLRYASVLELARQNFLLQLALLANTLYAIVQAIFLGLLATAFLVVLLRQGQVRHPWVEWLSRSIRRGSAEAWSWGLLVVPFAVGFGIALPTVLFLGLLWPVLKARERFLFVTLTAGLVAMPVLSSTLDRLTLPLDESRAPLYGVALAETEPASPERTARLVALAHQHPDNAYLQFAAGWASRRTGALEAAEEFYRRTLQLWPTDDRTLNDLGATLMMRGRTDEAFALFVKATQLNSGNAAAWFNQSQVSTQRFDYRTATDALSRASAINFEMVKSYQAQGTDDGALVLIEQWMSPARLWNAVAAGRSDATVHGALPPSWRRCIETRGWPFSIATLIVALVAIVGGARMQKNLPLRSCSNCGRTVCRRCSERRRELALCPACVEAEKRAESPDFARLLLHQVRRRRERVHDLVQTALATLVPGWGLVAFHRVFSPLVILIGVMALLGPLFGSVPPFAFEPRLALAPPGLPWQAQAASWIVLYAWSLLGFFRMLRRRKAQSAQAASPARGRSSQSSARALDEEAA